MLVAALVGTMVLFGQLDAPTMTREQVLRQELVTLLDQKPTFTAPIVFLSLSATSLALGVAMLVVTFEGSVGMGAFATILLAMTSGAAAIAFAIVGFVMLGSRLQKQRRMAARIEAVEKELAQPPPPSPEPPPGVWLGQPGGLLLARF